jgi:hypothetical protein
VIALILFSGAWGKMIHKKNMKQNSPGTVPLKAQNSTAHAAEEYRWLV